MGRELRQPSGFLSSLALVAERLKGEPWIKSWSLVSSCASHMRGVIALTQAMGLLILMYKSAWEVLGRLPCVIFGPITGPSNFIQFVPFVIDPGVYETTDLVAPFVAYFLAP